MHFYVDLALGKHYYIFMLTQTKAPQSAGDTLKGVPSHAIDSRMSLDNSIVSYRREKGNHNGLLQLQYSMQKIREVRSQEDPALSLQEMRSHVL